MALWRIAVDGTERLARGPATEGPAELLPSGLTIDAILDGTGPSLHQALTELATTPLTARPQVLAPIGSQEVWATGVTYLRSRDARKEESESQGDHYDHVYDAPRPEIFFKATPARVRGPGEAIGIRADSSWDVPEPELGLVLDASGALIGYVVGDDVSSRSIEGENPLYLPQAKNYTGSCALGPCLVSVEEAPPFDELTITLTISRAGSTFYRDQVAVTQMKRQPEELAEWLFRALEFPIGAVLLTGTAIVPPSEFTLEPGDRVAIGINGLGVLENPVERVGAAISGVPA